MRIGGHKTNTLGTAVGVAAVVLTIGLLALYLPGMPAGLDVPTYVMFGLWWLLGLIFLVRIPRGVKPGVNAEEDLVNKLASMGRGPKATRK